MPRTAVILFASLFLSASASAQTQSWQLDPPHCAAQFAVRHMGISTVRGTFTKVQGTVRFDPADPTKLSIEVTIDPSSVDSRVEARDNDLRGANLLDVQHFPTITFQSKRAEVIGKGKLKVTGDLTIHGMKKEVVLEVDGPTGPVKDPRGNMHMGASASATINRRDFGVSGYPAAMVGDDVIITIDVEMVQSVSGNP